MRHESVHFCDGAGGTVSAVVASPEGAVPPVSSTVVLAHGAGNDMTNPFLVAVHQGLARRGFTAVRFNFPYKERGGKAPDRGPVLETCYRAVVDDVRDRLRPRRLVIGGKSLGGRIASQIAAGGSDVDGLLLLGYPLHPPNRPERLRDAHLPGVRAPMLFFAGTRDSLCDLALLRRTMKKLKAPAKLHVVEDGDHSFKVLKRTGRTQEEVHEEIVAVAAEWLEDVGLRRAPPAPTRR